MREGLLTEAFRIHLIHNAKGIIHVQKHFKLFQNLICISSYLAILNLRIFLEKYSHMYTMQGIHCNIPYYSDQLYMIKCPIR